MAEPLGDARPDESDDVTDADKVLALGTTIKLANGASADLVYDFPSVRRLEKRFGSFNQYLDNIRNTEGPFFATMLFTFQLLLGVAEEEDMEALIDLREVPNYSAAMWRALRESGLVSGGEEAPQEDSPGNAKAANGSHGAASSSPRSSSGASRRNRSGA